MNITFQRWIDAKLNKVVRISPKYKIKEIPCYSGFAIPEFQKLLQKVGNLRLF